MSIRSKRKYLRFLCTYLSKQDSLGCHSALCCDGHSLVKRLFLLSLCFYPTAEGTIASHIPPSLSLSLCLSVCLFPPSLLMLEHMTSTPTFSHVNYQRPHPGVRSHPRKTNQSNRRALLLECGFVTPTVIYHVLNRC